MMSAPSTLAPAAWTQLLLGVIVMAAISSPQYVWTLFTNPLGKATQASPALSRLRSRSSWCCRHGSRRPKAF